MLYLITLVTDFAGILVVFTVSRHLAEQNASSIFIGSIGALYAAAATVSNAFAGPLADRLGLRLVAVTGATMLLAAVGALVALNPLGWPYFAAYALSAAALGLIYPPVISWLAQGRTDKSLRRAYFGFCIAFNVGVLSGQMAGGWLFEGGGAAWPLLAALLLVAFNLVLMLCAKRPPASNGEARSDKVETPPPEQALSATFARLCWIANFGGTFAFSIVIYLFPKLSVALGVPAGEHGMLLGLSRMVGLSTFCLMYLSTFWLHRFSVALVSQALGILGLVGLATAQSQLSLLLGLAGLSVLVGYNYYAGLYYSTAGRPDEQKSSGGGIHEATLALGLAGGSLCGGAAGSYGGDRAPFWLAAGVLTVLAVVQIVLYRRSRISGR